MSRAAVLDALRASLSIPGANIITNFSGEGRPANLDPGLFLVLRWQEQEFNATLKRGPRILEIWAHQPKELGTSYNEIDSILFDCVETLDALTDVPGADGFTLTQVDYSGGMSADRFDPAFNTIVRTATFKVLSRPT